MSKFVKPENLEFPATYRKFSSPKDSELKFRIGELQNENFDRAIDLIEHHFLAEETIHVSKKIAESEEKRENSKGFYRETLEENLSIGCFREDTGELVAINVMVVSSKDDEKMVVSILLRSKYYQQRTRCKMKQTFIIFFFRFQVEDQTSKEIIELFNYAKSECNIFEIFKVDQYLTSYALVVDSAYRGHGIATEILKARVEILKAFNLKVTSTIFTTIGSQVAGKKAGFDEIWQISYEELEKKFPTFDFSKANAKYFKTMSFKIE